MAAGQALIPHTSCTSLVSFAGVETDTQIMIARDLDDLSPTAADTLLLVAELGRVPNGLIASRK